MKLVTATLVALSGLSLCAAPLVFAQTKDNSGVDSKLKSMEDTWAASQMQKDHGANAVEGMLATDFSGVFSKVEIGNKTSQLEHMRVDTDIYSYSKNDKMDVHVYGANIATVVGTSTEKGKDKDGKDFSRSFAWSVPGWNAMANGNASPATVRFYQPRNNAVRRGKSAQD